MHIDIMVYIKHCETYDKNAVLEAVRQISLELGPKNSLFIHVTLVPFLRGSDEHKLSLIHI